MGLWSSFAAQRPRGGWSVSAHRSVVKLVGLALPPAPRWSMWCPPPRCSVLLAIYAVHSEYSDITRKALDSRDENEKACLSLELRAVGSIIDIAERSMFAFNQNASHGLTHAV